MITTLRGQIATWPDPWRERWGRLAGALEELEGLAWYDAEERAFYQIDAERAAGQLPVPFGHRDADLRRDPPRVTHTQALLALGGAR